MSSKIQQFPMLAYMGSNCSQLIDKVNVTIVMTSDFGAKAG